MSRVPQLLSPAGSLDAVRAAVANGADAVYLGVERFNARDEGAQLTAEELDAACRIAHGRGARVYLTLNTLLKPAELGDALMLLGDAIESGVDAAIVQDVGLVRLIQRIYPGFELHGSTQMTVHDASGAAVLRALGVPRVVLARESTLEDIALIRQAVPDLELESFVHGALCISYSGQCLMSGMISERSANRGSCAQSCRKDYVLTDAVTGHELDRGYLISARDLAAVEHLEALASLGIVCLKVEGRKKRPEYVATVTRQYRGALDRLARGEAPVLADDERRDLLQIYSRGFTGGMYGGRAGREYVTREQADNRGIVLGVVVGRERGELIVDVSVPIEPGDGLGFEPDVARPNESTGFVANSVRTLASRDGMHRQALPARSPVPVGWRVIRTAHAVLLERARASYASVSAAPGARRTRLDVRAFGGAGAPLKLVFTADGETVTARGEKELTPAHRHALDVPLLREHLGKLGETPFALGDVDATGLAPGLFIPVSELNHIRQRATEQLMLSRDWRRQARLAERRATIEAAVREGSVTPRPPSAAPFVLAADVYRLEDARAAANAGATEIALDPFLRHPTPPVSRVRAMSEELTARGVVFRLRTPTIVRASERRSLDRWLALDTPVLSGHLGLVAELAAAGRDVVADYAVNCFNQHAASEYFRLGAGRVVLSVELTADEMAQVAAPWGGDGFDVLVYGRPEGMTIEHCVLSAAFDRVPASCRDLCVQKHPLVELTDPSGYTFPVATDSACRNRLLHSRPIDGSEFVPRLWSAGLRSYRLLLNVPGEPVGELVERYREMLEALSAGAPASPAAAAGVRALVGPEFTRGHFARAV